MKRTFCTLAIGMTLYLGSCVAGPHQLSRSVDDWDQKSYVANPWMNVLWYIIPVIPICKYVAAIGDFFITDAYAFWFKDAWDMKGTAYTHFNPTPTDGSMSSLLLDDGKFLEIK